MSRSLNIYILLILVFLLSCGQKETIIPMYKTETASQQQYNRNSGSGDGTQIGPNGQTRTTGDDKIYYLRGKYYLSDIQVNRAVNGPILISSFGNILADMIVRIGGQFEVDMDPIPVDISSLDKDLVKSIVFKSVKLEILDNPEKANLKFLKKVQMFISIEDSNGESSQELMLMSYDRTNDYDYANSKQCDWMCTELNINPMNILDYIGSSKSIVIRPSVKIGSVPKEKFLLGGYLEFEIGLALPL
ncbi:MAG: hypothetical protein HN576_14110 [Bacteriovoracaceae bacterium]|nr:hypothetical protein [Bacteriovoracaceae bacterium]